MKIKIGEVEGMKKREGREFIGKTERIDECVNRIKYRRNSERKKFLN